MSVESLQTHLLNYPESLIKELTVVKQIEHEIPLMLHISTNLALKDMVPRIGARQMPSEDRTMPRICCAPSLYGCVLGYQTMTEDYINQSQPTEKNPNSKWKNGYRIYHIPYEYGIRPSTALVPDVEQTDETWLISYSPQTRQYNPVEVGNFFASQITIVNRSGKKPFAMSTLYVEVSYDPGIHFSKNIFLKKGYWKVHAKTEDYQTWKATSWQKDEAFEAIELSKDEYFSQKRASADLLSHQDKLPEWMKW